MQFFKIKSVMGLPKEIEYKVLSHSNTYQGAQEKILGLEDNEGRWVTYGKDLQRIATEFYKNLYLEKR